MRYGFIIDNRKCIGCHACTVACKSEHDVPIGVNRTWVKYVEKGEYPHTRRVFSVHRCNHCTDAPCVTICPVHSLYIRKDGIVDFDSQRCIGCKSCMQACPYDALYIDPNHGTSAKCNYCAHRIDQGLEPACVVVCPTHAIISGDIEQPDSEIGRLLARQQVTVRKPEKSTGPNLFYIEGDGAALVPTAAPPQGSYFNSEQGGGVGHHAGAALTGRSAPAAAVGPGIGGTPEASARRTYDAPEKGVLWNWEVSGYLWTKSIAAGVLAVPLALGLAGMLSLPPAFERVLGWIALGFLALTGALLVKDLDRPDRFLYVLLRPQWRSWLTRGAYLIMIFGALAGVWLLWMHLEGAAPPLLRAGVALSGALVAVYTAFLLAQAKGRDLWQSPLLPLHMLIQSGLAGASTVLLAGLVVGVEAAPALINVLRAGITALLFLLLLEFTLTHPTGDTERALAIIAKGQLSKHFWSAVAIGLLFPLGLLALLPTGLLPTGLLPGHWAAVAGALVLAGGLLMEHVWVRAPQLISLR